MAVRSRAQWAKPGMIGAVAFFVLPTLVLALPVINASRAVLSPTASIGAQDPPKIEYSLPEVFNRRGESSGTPAPAPTGSLLMHTEGVPYYPEGSDWGDDRAYVDEYPESHAICRRVRDREPLLSDRPDAQTADDLIGCNSEALYYGIGMAADPVRARTCAFIEESAAAYRPFEGRGMLMTIYANGVGATRDLDVATHIACGLSSAPAETDHRVRHLARLEASGWTGDNFHYCDDAMSTRGMTDCIEHQANISSAERETRLRALTAGATADEHRLFHTLARAHERFVEARRDEVDMSGSLGVPAALAEQESIRDEWLAMLERLSAGRAPAFSAAQFRDEDRRLNHAYRVALRPPQERYPAQVTAEQIRTAQRAWLRYRDAFLAFASLKFPNVTRESLAAWLTLQRTAMLTTPVEY